MIPKSEMRLLAETVAEAFTASADGHRRRGVSLLAKGLERAAQARARGEEWADELEQHYRRSLGSYGDPAPTASAGQPERKAA